MAAGQCCDNLKTGLTGGWRALSRAQIENEQGMFEDWIISELVDRELSYQGLKIRKVMKQMVNGTNYCLSFQVGKKVYSMRVYQPLRADADPEVVYFLSCK